MGAVTRYTRSGDLYIAYQVVGDAPLDLVYVPTWISQIEVLSAEPTIHAFMGRLNSFARA